MALPLEHVPTDPLIDRNFQAISAAANSPIPQARVFKSTVTTLTTGVAAFMTFDSERWDNGNLHSTSTNTGQLVAPTAGLYEMGTSIEFATNATGMRQVLLYVNGTTIAGGSAQQGVATFTTIVNVNVQYQLAAGDNVTVRVFQASGGNLNVNASSGATAYASEFWMVRLAGFTNQL